MKHGKTDANQRLIVDGLRRAGASVYITSDVGRDFVDLVAGFRGRNYLIEVKTETGKLTPGQRLFHDTWNGHIAIVRNLDEALRIIGAI